MFPRQIHDRNLLVRPLTDWTQHKVLLPCTFPSQKMGVSSENPVLAATSRYWRISSLVSSPNAVRGSTLTSSAFQDPLRFPEPVTIFPSAWALCLRWSTSYPDRHLSGIVHVVTYRFV